MNGITRRGFVRIAGSAVAAVAGGRVTLLEPKMLWAANHRHLPTRFDSGIIGTGTQGSDLLRNALKVPGAECVAVSDLYDTRLEHAKTILTKNVDTTKDYRRILDRKDVDAVIVATPDHWHRKLVVEATQAGKDVYCEKPMSHSAEDGFAMVEAVKKNNRICQIGSQRVSSIMYAKAKEIWDSGRLGQVDTIEAVWDRNSDSGAWMFPIPPDANEKTIDWNTWLGDTPKRPFDGRRFVSWRCYKDYGTGLPGDLFVHLISGINYITGVNAPPARAFSTGGIYHYKERDFGDLQWTIYDYPKFQVILRCNQNNRYEDQQFRILREKGNDVYSRSRCASGFGRGRITILCSRAAVPDGRRVFDWFVAGNAGRRVPGEMGERTSWACRGAGKVGSGRRSVRCASGVQRSGGSPGELLPGGSNAQAGCRKRDVRKCRSAHGMSHVEPFLLQQDNRRLGHGFQQDQKCLIYTSERIKHEAS